MTKVPEHHQTLKLPYLHPGGSCWVSGRHLAIGGHKGRLMMLNLDTGIVESATVNVERGRLLTINPWDSQFCFVTGDSRLDDAKLVSYQKAEMRDLPIGTPPVLKDNLGYFYGWKTNEKLQRAFELDGYLSGTLWTNELIYGSKKSKSGDFLFGSFNFLTGEQVTAFPDYGLMHCFWKKNNLGVYFRMDNRDKARPVKSVFKYCELSGELLEFDHLSIEVINVTKGGVVCSPLPVSLDSRSYMAGGSGANFPFYDLESGKLLSNLHLEDYLGLSSLVCEEGLLLHLSQSQLALFDFHSAQKIWEIKVPKRRWARLVIDNESNTLYRIGGKSVEVYDCNLSSAPGAACT